MATRIDLPMTPHAFREFIVQCIRSDDFFNTCCESPGDSLRNFGVPLAESGFSKTDAVNLLDVIGRVKNYVIKNGDPKTFNFNDLFNVIDIVSETTDDKKTAMCCNTSWDASDPSCYSNSGSNTSWNQDFTKDSVGWSVYDPFASAPLLSQTALTVLLGKIKNGLPK